MTAESRTLAVCLLLTVAHSDNGPLHGLCPLWNFSCTVKFFYCVYHLLLAFAKNILILTLYDTV